MITPFRNLSSEEKEFRKAVIEAGCELYFKMATPTGRLPKNCWSKIMEDLGSPGWIKRDHIYSEIKRKRLQQPKVQTQTPAEPIVNKSVITKSNDDVSEASTLDELVKTIVSTENNDDLSALTECGPEDRQYSIKGKSYAKADLKKVKRTLYSSPSNPPKEKTTRHAKRAKVSE